MLPYAIIAGTTSGILNPVDGSALSLTDLDGRYANSSDIRLAAPIQAEDAAGAPIGSRYSALREGGSVSLTDLGGGKLGVSVAPAAPGVMVARARRPFTAKLSVKDQVIPCGSTPPQITQGAFVVEVPLNPKRVGNKVLIRGQVCWSGLNNDRDYAAAVFESGSPNAVGATVTHRGGGADVLQEAAYVEGEFTVTELRAHTFSLRFGPCTTGGDPYVNADPSGAHNQIFGSAISTFIEVQEFAE